MIISSTMKAWLKLAVRLGAVAIILWEVYPETGPWTVLSFALSFAAAEAAAFYTVNVWEVVKMEMEERHNEKTVAALRARLTLRGVSYK